MGDIKDWEKEFEKLLPSGDIIRVDNRIVCSRQAIINFIRKLLSQQKQEIVGEIEKPANWDNWSIERQLGYNFVLNQLKQNMTKNL